MRSLYKEYDYTAERWRKLGKITKRDTLKFGTQEPAIVAFSKLVVEVFGKDTYGATLSATDEESVEVTHPKTGEERHLTIKFDEYHGYSVYASHV